MNKSPKLPATNHPWRKPINTHFNMVRAKKPYRGLSKKEYVDSVSALIHRTEERRGVSE